jgi:hypothetical protein
VPDTPQSAEELATILRANRPMTGHERITVARAIELLRAREKAWREEAEKWRELNDNSDIGVEMLGRNQISDEVVEQSTRLWKEALSARARTDALIEQQKGETKCSTSGVTSPTTTGSPTPRSSGRWSIGSSGSCRRRVCQTRERGAMMMRRERRMGETPNQIDELRAKLAEALKYGAPENTRSTIPRKAKCEHNEYWTTHYGNCMACRATSAEAERETLRASLAEKVGQLDEAVMAQGSLRIKLSVAESELAETKEFLHYAKGIADLAIQHRDAAEKELASLRAERDRMVKALAEIRVCVKGADAMSKIEGCRSDKFDGVNHWSDLDEIGGIISALPVPSTGVTGAPPLGSGHYSHEA